MNTSALVLRMALFVLAGAPLVWVVWEAVNRLLMGHPEEVRWPGTLAALALLIGLLVLVGRSASRLGGAETD